MDPGVSFTCNVCGRPASAARSELDREAPTCQSCGSSVRYRAIVHLLSTRLFGQSLALPDFPRRPELIGLGMSDWQTFSESIGSKLGYTNTFYDREPRLDLTATPDEFRGSLDFLVCSEVLEHVAPPVERAITGCFELLKPGGDLLLTVPYTWEDETEEHFPELYDYEILEREGRAVLMNRTIDGRRQTFRNLLFHGGEGETLEMRLFSRGELLRQLDDAGFADVSEMTDDVEWCGIIWLAPWSLPITARRPLE